jgi:uncharacterized membrane protein
MKPMTSRRSQLLYWIERGAVDPARGLEAARVAGLLPDGARWLRFIDGLLLLSGALALASGVVFFVAFNWDALGRFGKFALVQALLLAAVLLYWRLGALKTAGQAALLVAAILLGVLLALYGQTYQTGADPWQLFASWALLMLPFALVGRFAPLWLLWLLLLNLAAALWHDARFGLLGVAFASKDDVVWLLFLLNTLAWATWELAARGREWLNLHRWPVRLIATASGWAITVLVLRSIFDPDSPPAALAWGVFFLWLGAVYLAYRRRPPGLGTDLYMLAGACLAVIVCVTGFLGWLLIDASASAAALLLIALLVIAQAGAAAEWLRRVHGVSAAGGSAP